MTSKWHWLVPSGLVALSLVPVAAGSARLAQLAGGAPATAANERFVSTPLPVVLHIVGATVFCLLGALQFSSSPWPARVGMREPHDVEVSLVGAPSEGAF